MFESRIVWYYENDNLGIKRQIFFISFYLSSFHVQYVSRLTTFGIHRKSYNSGKSADKIAQDLHHQCHIALSISDFLCTQFVNNSVIAKIKQTKETWPKWSTEYHNENDIFLLFKMASSSMNSAPQPMRPVIDLGTHSTIVSKSVCIASWTSGIHSWTS